MKNKKKDIQEEIKFNFLIEENNKIKIEKVTAQSTVKTAIVIMLPQSSIYNIYNIYFIIINYN